MGYRLPRDLRRRARRDLEDGASVPAAGEGAARAVSIILRRFLIQWACTMTVKRRPGAIQANVLRATVPPSCILK